MYFKWGSYQHPANEVNLMSFEALTRFSARNREETVLYRMHVIGELLAVGQAAIHAAIQNFLTVYSVSNQDAGLYHDDGTPTRHFLQNDHASSLTGNLLKVHSWPKGEPEEYATQRTFHLVIEAEWARQQAELLEWHERVHMTGNCGPRYKYHEFPVGPPFRETINAQTIQEIEQKGYAVGFSTFPITHVPPPLYPAYEDEDLRIVSSASPRNHGRLFTSYRMDWRYIMHSDVPQSGLPHIEF